MVQKYVYTDGQALDGPSQLSPEMSETLKQNKVPSDALRCHLDVLRLRSQLGHSVQ